MSDDYNLVPYLERTNRRLFWDNVGAGLLVAGILAALVAWSIYWPA